jgi:prepilin-type N-terminal cleavage/methylation domain-containing protein
MISLTGLIKMFNGGSCKGFTLLELLFVTIVILVLISISTPLFKRTYDNLRHDEFSRNIAKLMKYAHERAIIERVQYRVCFDLNSKTYQIKVEEDPLNQRGVFCEVNGKFGKLNRIPDDVSLESSTKEVTFYPDGTVDEASLVVSSTCGAVSTLTTITGTGDVKIRRDIEE